MDIQGRLTQPWRLYFSFSIIPLNMLVMSCGVMLSSFGIMAKISCPCVHAIGRQSCHHFSIIGGISDLCNTACQYKTNLTYWQASPRFSSVLLPSSQARENKGGIL